ncbi:MAG: hypothetical protein WCD51_05135, partial [Anaerolineae bacterium]
MPLGGFTQALFALQRGQGMYYFLLRIWMFVAFAISIGIGTFLVGGLGFLDDFGYPAGCVLGIVIWAIGVSLLSR